MTYQAKLVAPLALTLLAFGCGKDRRSSDSREMSASEPKEDAGAEKVEDPNGFGNAMPVAGADAGGRDDGGVDAGDDGLDLPDGCRPERCGDDEDDDCDGSIDEGCRCDGEGRPCFPQQSAAAGGVGMCTMGTQSCGGTSEFSTWGACTGYVLPGDEVCDGELDEDCDGAVDEGLGDCCTPGEMRDCGMGEGICVPGRQYCDTHRMWSECKGATGPGELTDVCNGKDDDCDERIDEDFDPKNTPGQTIVDGGLYEAHWYTGNFIIDWRVEPPLLDCPAAGSAFEGSSTWSDPLTGDLLFYSNGLTLWDASGAVVPNGGGLSGNMTATETSFFAPVPGSQLGELMVFVNDTTNVYYSLLDLATGVLDTATKNTLVATGTGEAIGGVDDLSGGFWLVLFNGATLDAYHVTSRTIAAAPDAQSPLPVTVDPASRGTIRFSRDRTRVVFATETPNGLWWANFDPTTGSVAGSWTQVSPLSGYAVDFSPNGQMIYFAASAGNMGWSSSELWQFDTALGTGTVIANGSFSGVALGPDGNIYAHENQAPALDRVANPDVGGAANFTADALTIPTSCKTGFNLSKQLFLPSVVGCTQESCDDDNPCTADLCDEKTGACTHTCSECS